MTISDNAIISDSVNCQVVAVIVTYYPKTEILHDLLTALIPQVTRIVIVDNTPSADTTAPSTIKKLASSSEINLIRLGENYGLARALNVGIVWAIRAGATYVLLSDQDSLPSVDMIKRLLFVARQLVAQGVRIGCVGPAFREASTGQIHEFQIPGQGFFYTRFAGDKAVPWAEVISNITSGSLIPAHLFADVGLMRENYFIDFVDTEWCFRARSRGYRLYATSQAFMEHCVGDANFRAWYGTWKSFSGYSPQRLYYQYRNGVFLLRENLIPFGWKLRLSWTWLGNMYAYVFFAPHRLKNLKAILSGLLDGVRGFSGSLDVSNLEKGESITSDPEFRK